MSDVMALQKTMYFADRPRQSTGDQNRRNADIKAVVLVRGKTDTNMLEWQRKRNHTPFH